jgi:trigger factor
LRGKETTFHVELTELKRRVLPDIDDELAKDCEYESLSAMRKAVSERVEGELKRQSEETLARALVARLCENNPVPVPPSLVEQQARISERELRMVAQMSGQRIDAAEMAPRIRADAEMKVRAGLLMAEIAKTQGVQVTSEDLESGYQELAAQSGKNVAKVKAEYREKGKRDMLIGMILEDKVLDLMEKSAKINEPSTGKTKAAADETASASAPTEAAAAEASSDPNPSNPNPSDPNPSDPNPSDPNPSDRAPSAKPTAKAKKAKSAT